MTQALLHGSSVAFESGAEWCAALILGASGAGKSELALELIAIGATLVADDQTCLERVGTTVRLSAPPAIRGMIEMRGLGIIRVPSIDVARLAVIVDLDETERERMPEPAYAQVQGIAVRRLRKCEGGAFAAGLKLYILSREWDG